MLPEMRCDSLWKPLVNVCVEYVVQGTSRNLKIEFKDDVVLPMST